jgi:hypothetical protein
MTLRWGMRALTLVHRQDQAVTFRRDKLPGGAVDIKGLQGNRRGKAGWLSASLGLFRSRRTRYASPVALRPARCDGSPYEIDPARRDSRTARGKRMTLGPACLRSRRRPCY